MPYNPMRSSTSLYGTGIMCKSVTAYCLSESPVLRRVVMFREADGTKRLAMVMRDCGPSVHTVLREFSDEGGMPLEVRSRGPLWQRRAWVDAPETPSRCAGSC